jgi:hypothetical protein
MRYCYSFPDSVFSFHDEVYIQVYSFEKSCRSDLSSSSQPSD